jgi:exodeoxyribonuclease VII small subunit
MSEGMHFDEAKERLESIVVEVRKKDTSLERSIELLEEGVRLANVCVERIDETYAAEGSEEDAAIPALGEDSDGTVTDAP